MFRHLSMYVVVGLMALAVDVSVFSMSRWGGLELWMANPLARLMGSVTAYTLNHFWTFRQRTDGRSWMASGWRYALVWLGATGLATVAVVVLADMGLKEIYAKILVEGSMPLLNFLIARYWVFSKPKEGLE